MKFLTQSLFLAAFACLLSGCLFKEAVFTDGFSKVDPALGGVWAADGENDDPRKTEFAVCAPLDDDRYVLHYPSFGKDSLYYEVRPLQVRSRTLLQLRVLASFGNGLPKADAERFTVLWIEKDAGGKSLRVRALGEGDVKEKGPAAARKLLEDPASDWNKAFGESMTFRRLKDE